MFRLLIVEDEKMLRESLAVMVDWESAGVEVAGLAENGREALDILQRQPVDLVLTDIRMPAMDGLELACEIQNRYPQIKTVLYSAYSEFSFAQKGIEYGVSGYLLKSQDEEEIAAYFQELCRRMEKEQSMQTSGLHGDGNLWSWREELFDQLCRGEGFGNSDLPERCKISRHNGKMAMTLWNLDHADMLREELGATEFRQLSKLFSEQALTRIEWQGYGYLLRTYDPLAVIWTDFEPGWQQRLEQLQKEVHTDLEMFESSFPVTVTVSFGSCVTDASSLPQSWESAQCALNKKFYLGNGKIIFGESQDYPCEQLSPEGEAQQALREASALCREKDCTAMLHLLNSLHISWTQRGILDRHTVKTFSTQFILLLTAAADGQGEENNALVSRGAEVLHTISRADTLDMIFDRLLLVTQEFLQASPYGGGVLSDADHPPKRIVEKAMQYLKENFAEEVSLERVAAYVSVHPVHLSRLFRQETGQTFKEILTHLRIDAAKELLQDLDLRVYEISERVGYHKPRYFSELFKEMTGMTPLEYREKR